MKILWLNFGRYKGYSWWIGRNIHIIFDRIYFKKYKWSPFVWMRIIIIKDE